MSNGTGSRGVAPSPAAGCFVTGGGAMTCRTQQLLYSAGSSAPAAPTGAYASTTPVAVPGTLQQRRQETVPSSPPCGRYCPAKKTSVAWHKGLVVPSG